jgi:hypothetical protein
MDTTTSERAEELACKSHPKPRKDPVEAGLLFAVLSSVVIGCFGMLDQWMGATLAWLVTIALAGGVGFLEYRQRWHAHAQAYEDAIAFLDRIEKPIEDASGPRNDQV